VINPQLVKNPWRSVKKSIARILSDAASVSDHEMNQSLEVPPDSKLGDIATTIAFDFAKKLRKNPSAIAQEIAQQIEVRIPEEALLAQVMFKGPYINLYLDRGEFSKYVLEAVQAMGEEYGTIDDYNGKRALIESPAVNPNNPWHIGHTRNAVLGDTLGNTLQTVGYDVVRMDYINNLGLQIAQLVWKLQHLDTQDTDMKYDHFLGLHYVAVQEDFEKNEQANREIRQVSRDLEDPNTKASKDNHEMVTKCVKAHYQTGYRLGIYHDYQLWESDIAHSGLLDLAKNMMLDSENIVKLPNGPKAGCIVAKLDSIEEFKDMREPYKVLFRSDGTRTYTGADVALQMWKFGIVEDPFLYEVFETQPNGQDILRTSLKGRKSGIGKVDIVLNVIASPQSQPQRLVYTILDLLGYHEQSQNSHHIAYEFVGLEDESFSGRKGTWMGYSCDEVLDKAKELAYEEVVKRNPDMTDEMKDKVAEQVGVGAIRYMLLKASPDRKITFRWEEALNFNGDAGPYLQYSHARAQRILEKAKDIDPIKVDFSLLTSDEEFELVKAIARFPDEIREVVKGLKKNIWGTSFQTNRIASYCYNLANTFSRFYDSQPVIKSEPNIRAARLALVHAFKLTIAGCLRVLGIPVVERM
jgi:arginyl-tRNA synthetase